MAFKSNDKILKSRRVAVLDLGTNVFNLLLAEFSEKGVRGIREFKYPGYIGAGGLGGGLISEHAFTTADKAFSEIFKVIGECGGVDEVIPYATSAIRDAKNGTDFVNYFNGRYGMDIRVIPGEREAELIFRGILLSLSKEVFNGANALMLDIGGGSNEFIITDGGKILWKMSFPIGMARMRERFNYTDPVPEAIIREFSNFSAEVLTPLWSAVEIYRPTVLIGSSGSFDTFKDLIFNCCYRDIPAVELPCDKLTELGRKLLKSTSSDRLDMNGMSRIRVDYIVLAIVFTSLVLEKTGIRRIWQSSYSLKEGAMQEEFMRWKNGENIGSVER